VSSSDKSSWISFASFIMVEAGARYLASRDMLSHHWSPGGFVQGKQTHSRDRGCWQEHGQMQASFVLDRFLESANDLRARNFDCKDATTRFAKHQTVTLKWFRVQGRKGDCWSREELRRLE
jgi:hypothetical protein